MLITSKGQVTIPKRIREEAGLHPHAEVEFAMRGSDVLLRKAAFGRRGDEVVRRLRGKATESMSTDEIMALTRGAARSRISISAPMRRCAACVS